MACPIEKDVGVLELIGYSAFWLSESAFEYYEGACYIADTPESLKAFIDGLDSSSEREYEAVEVPVSDVLDDFGFTLGRYAFERGAFERFVRVIDKLGIDCKIVPDDPSADLQGAISKVHIEAFEDDSDVFEIIQEIIEDLSIADGVYKKSSIDTAIEYREEITPVLIDSLEEILSAPDEYANNPDYIFPVYAVMLLGHFKETKAHRPIIRLLSLPADTVYDLLGDIVHDEMPTVLFRTSGDSFDGIKSLVLDESTWVLVKAAALRSMVLGVLEGTLARDEALEFFSYLVLKKKDGFQPDFWRYFCWCVFDLYPLELMDIVKELFSENLISASSSDLPDFESAVKEDQELFLEQRRIEKRRRSFDDIHAAMSWWACFHPMEIPESWRSPVEHIETPMKKSKPNKKKKRKKKMKKASRKKNRR